MFTILFTQVLTIILIFVNEKLINHIKNLKVFYLFTLLKVFLLDLSYWYYKIQK